MDVSGDGKTKVELDGQNVLDSYGTDYPASYQAGLRKQGEGTLIITDETNNEGKKITTPKSESDTSGSLTAKGAGGNGAAGIGGSAAEGTKNIIIEGYATVDAAGGGYGAGIGGGGYYGKENLEMQKTSSSRAMQLFTQAATQALAAAMQEMQKTSSSGGIPR